MRDVRFDPYHHETTKPTTLMRIGHTFLRWSLPAVLALFLMSFSATDARAQLQIGGGLGFGNFYNNLGLQIGANLPVNEDRSIRGAADVIFFLKESRNDVDIKWWEINLNGHYLFLNTETFRLYALGGLNIVNWNAEVATPLGENPLIDTSRTELGLNIGGGGEYPLEVGVIYGELKYTLSDLDQLTFTAGFRLPLGGPR